PCAHPPSLYNRAVKLPTNTSVPGNPENTIRALVEVDCPLRASARRNGNRRRDRALGRSLVQMDKRRKPTPRDRDDAPAPPCSHSGIDCAKLNEAPIRGLARKAALALSIPLLLL